MNNIAIIGAMAAEVSYLKNSLNQLKTHHFGANITIYTGTLHNKNIALCQSGIGKVNATIATTLLIEHFAPDYIINTGSAGGIGKNLRVGDIVIGTHIAHHDVDVTAFGYQHGQIPQLPTQFNSDEKLIQLAHLAANTFDHIKVAQGLIVSGDQFVHHQKTIQTIEQHFINAQAIEMEAAAIAQTCYQLQKPFVIIRAISDSAEENATISFEQFLETAAQHSAKMVQKIIQQIK